ncbi:MAG TPA: protein kinase [Vicinamibacteria bacterium]|nr:protein kinase [Vicinamibacteria bacterium]
MTRRRGEDEPKAKHPPEAAAAPDRPGRLLTSEDIFGDMLDPGGGPARKPAAPPASSAAPRTGPIKVQVSEPGAARKEGRSTAGGGGEDLPADVAALLDAFAESPPVSGAEGAAPAEPPASEPAGESDGEDELLNEILTEGPPDPVSLEEEADSPASALVEHVAFGLDAEEDADEAEPLATGLVEEEPPQAPAAAEAAPFDPSHAEALRDLAELQPRRSILHPLDALGEAPRPASRMGTKFQAAPPKAAPEQGPALDLAAVAEGALVQPRPSPVDAPPPSPRVQVGGSPYGPYRLLERVAVGGMAEVFKAKRTGVEGFEKVLAVKRILPHLSENKEFVDMFIDEAKMVAGLAHPNIVQIFDLGKIEKSYYIAMEYVHGRDLRSILRRARERDVRMPLDLALLVVSKVSSALEFAHRKKDERGRAMQIVHRDVSPQNILISFEGDVKLTDFGIAKAATKASLTDAGALRGKLLYMSPEQAWGKPMDRRSDIFSLGIVFYEMVTDHRPFLGSSEMSILEMVRECRVVAPSTLNPRIPAKLENVIMMALAREADDRYQDAAELCRDLERVLHEWQPPRAGALARFLEVLFDEQERNDSVDEPEAPAAEAIQAADADVEAAAAEPEPAGAVVANDEFDITPPPTPEPAPPPRAPESLSQKLLKRFGIK